MKIIQSILAEMEQGSDLEALRCAIADLILDYLKHSQTVNNLTALDHLINAAGTLTLNINAVRQPTFLGLKVCIADIEKAIAELNSGSHVYQLRRNRVESISFDTLLDAVLVIQKKVCHADGDLQAA